MNPQLSRPSVGGVAQPHHHLKQLLKRNLSSSLLAWDAVLRRLTTAVFEYYANCVTEGLILLLLLAHSANPRLVSTEPPNPPYIPSTDNNPPAPDSTTPLARQLCQYSGKSYDHRILIFCIDPLEPNTETLYKKNFQFFKN